MTASCPKCEQNYEFATLRLQGKDRTARCTKCGHRFIVRLLGRPRAADTKTHASSPGGSGKTLVGRAVDRAGDAGLAPHVRIALTALDGPAKDQIFRITRSPTLIGRVQGDVRLSDPKVSGRHAEVEVAGGEVWLRDLGSTNGTFVNGKRVERARLKHMDEITVGATRLLYTYIEDFVSMYEAATPDG